MSRNGIRLGRMRLAAMALATGLVMILAGDGGRAATVPAVVQGQDPLEVLALKVRPNVVVVVDSSGSMKWTLDPSHGVTGSPVNSGDHPRSKLWQAKQVLKTIVEQNGDKASFLFGQYEQGGGATMQNRDTPPNPNSSGQNRFIYWTTDDAFPSMDTDELSVQRAVDDPSGSDRGLQSWQVIYQDWGTLWFEEDNGAECQATLAGTFPKFYARGGSGTSPAVSTTPQNLSFDLQTAMNNPTCTGGSAENTYEVSYSDGEFRFTATGPNEFRLRNRAAIATNNISEAFGGYDTLGWVAAGSAGGGGGGSTVNINASWLRRRSSGTTVYATHSHGLANGDTCTVTGASPGYFNGTWTVNAIYTSTRFRLSGPTGGNRWTNNTGTITCSTSGGGGPVAGGTARTETPHTLLYREDTPPSNNSTYDPAGWHLEFHNTFYEEVPPGSGIDITNYQLRAARFFNGEQIRVTSSGQVCGMTFPTAAERTNPPTLILQEVGANCGADVGTPVTFTWGGAYYAGGSGFCNGFRSRVDLVPCDLQSPPGPTQISTIGPWLENELIIEDDGTPDGYSERMDGTWDTLTYPPASAGGIKGYGSTPIAASLQDIRGIFTNLWNNGQAGTTNMAGPPPYQLDPIKNHLNPKEKTIVLFITDGDDTCASGSNDNQRALAAAYQAELLYRRIDAAEPGSSVQTFAIGYGGTVSGGRLDWIAWGGSGLGAPDVPNTGSRWAPPVSTSSESTITNWLAPRRADCSTCQDAFIAPDARTLEETLQGIIDQGASEGEFSAQQSITESIYEYVDLASDSEKTYAANIPSSRFSAIVPTRIISSFTMPGFRGRLRAIQNDGLDNPVEKWEAGEILRDHVANDDYGMGTCDTSARGGAVGECSFEQLHAGENETQIASPSSSAKIRRRIYTTERNGVYDFDAQSLVNGTADQRVTLWPPAVNGSIIPANYVDEAALPGGLSFDEALGLPSDSPTEYPPQPDADDRNYDVQCDPDDLIRVAGKSTTQCWLESLQLMGGCVGTALPSACTSGSTGERMKAARREVREMILAFMAGAQAVPANPGVKRATSSGGGVSRGDILYRAREWVLADSELATPAVVRAPLNAEPEGTPWLSEYRLFRDGFRNSGGRNPDTAGTQIRQGFGLRKPDNDSEMRTNEEDNRMDLKPLMTVVYAPANDMLHAFRAGPNITPSTDCNPANLTHECGGQEMWGFVPFDQLHVLGLRLKHQPQGRDNHVYMLARGVRFSDVFVPAENPPLTVGVSGVSEQVQGVWRRVLYIPRGIGGKYITALDVTGPGPYTASALETTGPIPLWNRGNPDTDDGTASGADNNSADDRLAYSAMGQTWSIPAVFFRDATSNQNPLYTTSRGEVTFGLFVGSGYGGTGEGTTIFTLDALSGDVIADVDVEVTAAANGLDRSGLNYDNAIPANVVVFNESSFQILKSVHPANTAPSRGYVGDIHGRLWKVLTREPDVAIPIADLGADQPVGTAVSLLGMPPYPDATVPHVYVSTGNFQDYLADDQPAPPDGPFINVAFRDDGQDDETTIGAGTTAAGVTTYFPAVLLEDSDGEPFVIEYDQGEALADCGYTEEGLFRGTIQPSTTFDCGVPGSCPEPIGRVFFGGTRLNLPNTKFAPPTPLACGEGNYPCRSSFDSIIYLLTAETGVAAYDLNASGDDSYRIFRDNRISAIAMMADPDTTRGGSRFNPDEGKMAGEPDPPPPPGVPPTATTATPNVIMKREPGKPPPSVHYGSTVCQ